jgi:hypothetical protein
MSESALQNPVRQPSSHSSWLALAPAAALALVTVGIGATSAYAPPETGQMAVVFPPWVGEVEAFEKVAEAGGRIVGPSRFGNIVVALAPDAGFSNRVGGMGALFTLKATGLCGPVSTGGPSS